MGKDANNESGVGGGRGAAAILERAASALERFTSSRARCFVAALIYSTVLFGFAMSAWQTSGVIDDWSISNALSGKWGEGEGLCLFLNALLCRAIVALNVAVPQFNWFFVFEMATGYVSLVVMMYLALSRSAPQTAFMLALGVAVFGVSGVTLESNFTYAAFFGICAGGMMLLCSLREEAHKPALVAGGVALMAVGYMWRSYLVLLAVALFGIAALFIALGKDRRVRGTARSLARLWPFALAICVFAGLHMYDSAAWGEQPWADWHVLNEARSSYSDYPHKPYEEIADDLAAIGVSENDYELMQNWTTEDPDFFTNERIAQVASIARADMFAPMRVARNIAGYFYHLAQMHRLALLILGTIVVVAFTTSGRTRKRALALIGLAALMGCVLYVLGRLPVRIHYPLWMLALAAVSCVVPPLRAEARGRAADASATGGLAELRGSMRGAHVPQGLRARSAFANLLVVATLAAPCAGFAFILHASLPFICPERAGAVFAADTFEPHSALLDYMDENPDAHFVFNAGSNFDLVFSHYMTAYQTAELNDRVVSIGGWGSRSPYAVVRNKRANMENPIKGLIDNPDAVYVAQQEVSVERMKTYLREHYYPKATYKELVVLPNWAGREGVVHIYKFKK